MTRSLGLDIGDKRIGVAVSDPGGILASPLTIIERRNETRDIADIVSIIEQNHVEVIVAGLPRSMRGGLGEQAEKVKEFVRQLASRTDILIKYRDERLTTVSARRLMTAASTRKAKKKQGRDDAVAAALILQGYLDESGGE